MGGGVSGNRCRVKSLAMAGGDDVHEDGLIILVFAATVFAAADVDETVGAWNGRAWNKMGRTMKVAYLRGAFDGDYLCQVTANVQSRWPAALTFGEIAKAVDFSIMIPLTLLCPLLLWHSRMVSARQMLQLMQN